MFGYKTFLRIGELNDSSAAGLYAEAYELESCTYNFSQGINADGKPQTNVRGGSIQITYCGLPKNDMMEWMLGSRKFQNGAIVICNDDDVPLEKVMFEKATCVNMEISYMQHGKSYITTKFTLSARKIQIGSTSIENHWTIKE